MVKTRAQQLEELFEELLEKTIGDVLPIIEKYIKLKESKGEEVKDSPSLPPTKSEEKFGGRPPF